MKIFETNNKTFALNILYIPYTFEEIQHAYISKHNSTHENQVILLMFIDGKKKYYFAVKNCLLYFAKYYQSIMETFPS